MRSKMRAFLIVILSLSASIVSVNCVPRSEKGKAEKAVSEFHERFNKAAFSEIYDSADQSLKNEFTREEFVNGLKAIREGHGAVQKTELIAIDYNYSSGVRLIKLLHRTNFEKAPADQQFIFVIDDTGPHLKSYIFR